MRKYEASAFGEYTYIRRLDGTALLRKYRGYSTDLTVPSEIDGHSVVRIELGAFKDCASPASVTLPDSVTSIQDKAFAGCTALASVAIPNSVASIGNAAFFRCTALTSIAIPDSVASIGCKAFEGCASLTSVTLPNGTRRSARECLPAAQG